MSMFFVFLLAGVVDLNLPEVLVIGVVCITVQSLWHALSRPRIVHVLFSAACVQMAAAATYLSYHYTPVVSSSFRMMVAATVIFVANNVPIAIVIAMTEGKSFREVWGHCYAWSFPYYLTGGAIVAALGWASPAFDWHVGILMIPMLYLLYRSYALRANQPQAALEHARARHTDAAEGAATESEARLDAVFNGTPARQPS